MQHKHFLIFCLFATGLLMVACSQPQAASAAPAGQVAPVSSSPPPAPVMPDYGGRESDIAPTVPKDAGTQTTDPIGQAMHAVEALAIVLGLVVFVVFALKRSGLVKTTGADQPFRSAVARAAVDRLARPAKPRRAPAAQAARNATPSGQIQLLCSQDLDEGSSLHLVSVNGRTLLLGASTQVVNVLMQWDEAALEPSIAGAADRLQALLEQSRRSDLRQSVVSAGRGEERR